MGLFEDGAVFPKRPEFKGGCVKDRKRELNLDRGKLLFSLEESVSGK
jgi:hypothetical protein